VAHLNWETDQIDAIKAFTQSDVDAEIYVVKCPRDSLWRATFSN